MERRFEARLDEMMEQAEVSPELLKDLLPRLNHLFGPLSKASASPNRNGIPLSTSPAWCLDWNARRARGSPTCMIKSDRESRSSLDLCRGTISRCSPLWRSRSARSWVKPMA